MKHSVAGGVRGSRELRKGLFAHVLIEMLLLVSERKKDHAREILGPGVEDLELLAGGRPSSRLDSVDYHGSAEWRARGITADRSSAEEVVAEGGD